MDTPNSPNDKTSNEDADEKKLTQEKVRLDNGTYNYVFIRNRDDTSRQYWRCNICDVVVGGPLLKHAMGKKHQAGLALPQHSASLWERAQTHRDTNTKLDLKLAPGEPVPPGFEDEVRGVTEIQASLDAYHSGPLIGLEYLVELSVYEDEREPQYVCLLCDKRGDPRTVMAHLVSFNHRMSYLMTHFPTAYRILNPFVKQFRRKVQNVVTSICDAIERRFGRLEPQATDKETFEREKQTFLDKILKDSHPSERQGQTFEYLIDVDLITSKPKGEVSSDHKSNDDQPKVQQYRKTESMPGCKESENRPKRDPSPPVVAAPEIKTKSSTKQGQRSLSSISSISSSSLSEPRSRSRSRSRSHSRSRSRGGGSRYARKRYEYVRRSRSRSRSPYRRYYRRSRSISRSPTRYRREAYTSPYYKESSRLPWQRSDYNRSRTHYASRRDTSKVELLKSERLEEYKKVCNEIDTEMKEVLENHERNPEKHPMYPDEWKKFWNRRYKELQAENKDPAKHDFKPEWIDYWNKRMKEMHENEIKAKKEAARKRLNLPEERTPISFKIQPGNPGKKSSEPRDEKSKSRERSIDNVIIIDDSKDDEPLERKRSRSRWESDYPRERYASREYYKSKQYREVPEREYKRKPPLSPDYSTTESGEINIVAVLRLLTALEEKLGSLGPKVIEMLSQALALEKAEANSSETLLDNEINCVLFETVKEKLKGQLLAGMVEPPAEKTFKNAIQKIAALSHFASERKKKKEKEMEGKVVQQPVKIPGIGSVDKAAIAKQIATALVLQGKTDVTQAELEQLINAVVGVAQASQESGKPVSTATFVQQLNTPAQSTNILSLLQTAMNPIKQETMSSTAQILQASKPADDPFSSLGNSSSMDSLSDAELRTLLQNFKDLCTDEQHNLISYLKKLEAREPDRVERLRKFVKLGPSSSSDAEKSYTSGRVSPFSNREAGSNPSIEELEKNAKPSKQEQIKIDSDEDEDYSFEDVFRAASKNVTEKQLAEERMKQEESKKLLDFQPDTSVDLTDTKMLIANLMGQLSKTTDSGINLLGLGSTQPQNTKENGPITTNYSGFLQTSYNPTPATPNPVPTSTKLVGYNIPATTQYRFTQSNPYSTNFSSIYSQTNNSVTQTSTIISSLMDTNFKPTVDTFKHSSNFPQQVSNQKPPVTSFLKQGSQFQHYNSRQNYY